MPLFARPGAIEVDMFFAFDGSKRKVSIPSLHTAKPDADNLAKLVLDVMQAEKIIADDKAVAKLTVVKHWKTWAGATIQIRPAAATPLAPAATHLDTEGLGSGGKPGWLN